jgi:two-component system sensor histidine kinase UhpB
MPLRLRVVLLIGLVLLARMALGALVAGYQVRHVLSEELAAGLGGARQTAASAFEDLPQSDHPVRDLRQLVATFDGNRHVRATLVGPGGYPVWTSRTDSSGAPPPRWFRYLLGRVPAAIALQVPGTGAGPETLVLTPTPDLDVQAAWSEFLALMGVLVSTAAAGLLLVYLVIGAAFRPLTLLAHQFRRIGAGDYSGRVADTGPSELLHLQRGFNHMAEELAATTERNRALTEQLAKLQEEERADIARDLHDEIGPYLFAVNLDAEMIAQLGESGRHAAIPERVREIQSAVQYMQRQVRDLLGRLRPTQVTEFGLKAAIEDLVRFWATRQPEITFDLSLPEDEIPEATAEVVYRIVQEAMNNAVRHGKPESVRILVARNGDGGLFVSVDDDGSPVASPAPGGATGSGLGLIGMRERVEAGGGSLTYGPNPDGPGWTTAARLRLAPTERSLAHQSIQGDRR